MEVLKFLKKSEIKKIFDEKSILVIEYLLKKVLFSQPELLSNQKQYNIQMTKEFLEQWVSQGLNWEIVGAGNYSIDVYSKIEKYGADVKFISAKVDKDNNFLSSESNETSLMQNFKNIGRELDQDFSNKDFNKILEGWKNILFIKINKPIKDHKLKGIYYFIFIRGGNSISLSIAKVNYHKIKDIRVSRITKTSAFIDGYINGRYGNVKIYKSKKRMELRCYAKNIEDDGLAIKWNFQKLLNDKGISLRDLVDNQKLFQNHIRKEIKRFFNFL